MFEESVAELYRALGRPPPGVLAADDPLTFVRQVHALARPGMPQLVIGGCVAFMLAVAALMAWPAPRTFLPPVVAIGVLSYFLVTLVGLEGVARPGLPLRIRLLPPVLLAILCISTGMAAFGTPMAAAQGAAMGVILYGMWIASGLVVGDLVGRMTLRRRGLAVPLLGSPAIGRSLVARLETALDDPHCERWRVEPLPAASPEELAAAVRLDALLDRLPIWPERHDLRAVLGRAVPDWRHSVIRRGRDLADPPMLVAAAPTLDRAAVAMTLLGDVVVALVGIGDRRDLRPEQKGMHPKNIARLAPLLSDPRLRQQFYDLPERLMRRAIAMDELKGGRQPAVIAQLAVAPELWQTVPVRIANMVSLELERHFPTLAIREGHAVIVIPGEEMKNGKPQTYR